jgi:hypothetical protein
MAGRTECCSYEPSLEDLLDDEVMAPVLRSAGFDPQGLRDMMAETARRIDEGRIDEGRIDEGRIDDRAARDRHRWDR